MIWEAHGVMNDRLKIKWGTSSWRANENHYYAGNGYRYKPGAVNFALAWFQQAMQVGHVD